MVRSSGAVWSIIGTIYDKMEYIGPEVCNAREQELLPLMEFAPFRMWYPLHTIPSEEYPDTTDGCQSMKKLALEVGDHPYARMIALYQKFPCSSMAHLLGKALASPRRLPLYELLYKKIQAASESWAIRDYGHELNDQIIHQRGNVARTLHAKASPVTIRCSRKAESRFWPWKKTHSPYWNPMTSSSGSSLWCQNARILPMD